jgi:hypothetical protein
MSMKKFMRCKKCSKKLIVLNDSGIWHFAFGRMLDEHGEPITVVDGENKIHPMPAVEMKIQGVIRMKCFSTKCREEYPDFWNEYQLFDES